MAEAFLYTLAGIVVGWLLGTTIVGLLLMYGPDLEKLLP